MRRREPDIQALRTALARELLAVSPRPGGWPRIRHALERPPARRPRRRVWLLLAGPLVAVALLAGALAMAGAASTRSSSGQLVGAAADRRRVRRAGRAHVAGGVRRG